MEAKATLKESLERSLSSFQKRPLATEASEYGTPDFEKHPKT